MLLKISASRCRFTPFAGYFRATTSPRGSDPLLYLFRVPNNGIGGCERADRCPQGIQLSC